MSPHLEARKSQDGYEGQDSQENQESACVVCFKPVKIYSVGECDHPVCFECSTRMRVLCLQNECPICRHQLHKVIFTPDCLPYKEINIQSFSNNFFERKYKIGFATEAAKNAYVKLLEHNCRKCGSNVGPFRNFITLKEHMKSEHDVFFCDLCVHNLKIFTGERKYYTREQLALHRRKGDPDDLSHKGHPLCEFCDDRFMDTDELYRHLRKHHLYCHLCDADGFDHYYGSYDCLRDHFRKEHFLCEEGECIENNLTAVFRSDIDLIAHKALEHGKGLSKQASRQARTLELQFTLTPRPPRLQRGPGGPPNIRLDRQKEEECEIRESIKEEIARTTTNVAIDTDSTEQFPSLGLSTAPVLTMTRPSTMVLRQSSGALARTEQNFPALGETSGTVTQTLRVNITHQPSIVSAGPSNAIIKTSNAMPNGPPKPNVAIQVHNRPSASHFKLEPAAPKHLNTKPSDMKSYTKVSDTKAFDEIRKFEDEFPSLNKKDRNLLINDYCSSTSTNSLAKKISSAPTTQVVQSFLKTPLVVSKIAPPAPTSNAFPALCPSSHLPSQPQWIVATKPKEKPKQTKVAPAPQIPTMTDIKNTEDFPSLALIPSRNKSKKSSKNDVSSLRQSTELENNKHENGKKEKKKSKSNDDNKIQYVPENSRKSMPLDNFIEKKSKDNSKALDSKAKKNESEPIWVEWKGKKNVFNNNHEEKTIPPEKSKQKPVVEQTAKKNKETPDLEQDFPVLGGGKGVSGFRNGKPNQPVASENKITYSENAKSKLSYSENLKMKPSNNDNNKNGVSQKENGKCKSPQIYNNDSTPVPPTSVFQSSVPPCNGFTFTNSSGQSYDIPVHNYLEPPNFTQRNKALVVNFMNALRSQESIKEFKDFSRQFREGVYSAESYFEHCQNAIGTDFETLFPELLALLPDISKQQELHKIYSESLSVSLESCATCGQILILDDYKSHIASHSLLTHFPALGSSHQTKPTWRK